MLKYYIAEGKEYQLEWDELDLGFVDEFINDCLLYEWFIVKNGKQEYDHAHTFREVIYYIINQVADGYEIRFEDSDLQQFSIQERRILDKLIAKLEEFRGQGGELRNE